MSSISDNRIAYYIAQNKFKLNIFISDLAKRFNLSRDVAYRNFQKAEELGLFKIKYFPPPIVVLEEKLKKKLALRDVFISERDTEINDQINSVASTANWYINRYLFDEMKIAIGGGRTLRKFVDEFRLEDPYRKIKSIEICTLNTDMVTKGKGELPTYISSFVAGEFSRRFSKDNIEVSFSKFHISEFRDKREKTFHLNECEDCKSILNLVSRADMIIVGIGCLNKEVDSTTKKFLEILQIDIEGLLKRGVIGEIAFNAYTLDGRLEKGFEESVMSLDAKELKRISSTKKRKSIIGIAYGREKIHAIIGAAKAKLINRLVLDEDTAEEINAKL